MIPLQKNRNIHSRIRLFLTFVWLLITCHARADFTLRVQTDLGGFDILMFHDDATDTVDNFMDYVNSGAYDGMLFHRYAENAGTPFVLQTGGYYFDPNLGPFFGEGSQEIPPIVDNLPLLNDFGRSNTRGTIAMAKLPTDPDSADSEWFINLADNSAILDIQNGGFTVFAEVQGNGMQLIDEIASYGVLATCVYFEFFPGICGEFANMPFRLQQNQFFFDNDTLFNIHSIGPDVDGDGAIDDDEIDGDGVGGPDNTQPNVASGPMLEMPTNYITVAAPSVSNQLTDFTVLGNTFRITRPESRACMLNGVDLPYGLTRFKVGVLAVGGSVAVDVILPAGSAPAGYYTYGPEWLAVGMYDPVDHWHAAPVFNGTIGAEINDHKVTLHLTDGGWGDADMLADGVITVAPGGAADNLPPIILSDGDCDGVDNSTENDPTNNLGDNNNDGIQDDVQSGVASLLDIIGNYLTIQANTTTHNLENVRVTDGQQLFLWRANPAPLSGTNFANGFIDFAISNVARGGGAEIKVILPVGHSADRFFLLGPEGNNPSEHWFNFTHNAQANDGTVLISGNELTLRFVDGGRGDRDRTANGVIYIVGAPGEGFALSVPGGGGCTFYGFERTPRAAGAWWLLFVLLLVMWIWRRDRSRPEQLLLQPDPVFRSVRLERRNARKIQNEL